MTNLERKIVVREATEAKKAKKFPPALLRRMQRANESISESFRDLRDLEDALYHQRFAMQAACPHPEKSISGTAPMYCGICKGRVRLVEVEA
jgi:hypothetical protein